ncbi:MAG TPA: DUF883 family protein [Candidatus Baltobacteraceae bacterium]|jgi:ElaB/YqjD/DUF883 family membrane-anchored ribosome-binding protein|nr:DUF883 family protein [Candidatus Baltobacteraceae bacterium]
MSRYETPTALRHDARTLAEDARALLDATADLTDKKIAEARQRLSDALESGKQTYARLTDKAVQGAQAVDETIRSNPYQALAIAFGVGALLGFLASRRD